MKNIFENIDHGDMENILLPKVTVDEYKSRVGKDKDIVTLAFTVKSEQAGKDLTSWFERGYDFVLDAKVSDGEISPGKYLVFVEMNRRRSVPERIIKLLSDLRVLSKLKLNDWTIIVDEEDYEADEEVLEQVIITSPHEYMISKEKEKEDELNEMRTIAGLSNTNLYEEDIAIRNMKTIAGL